jgi:hypothetical protein
MDASRRGRPGSSQFYINDGSGSPIGWDAVIVVQFTFSVAIAPIVTSLARESWCTAQLLLRDIGPVYPQFIGRSEAFINRYGVSVFLARFTAVVRAFVPLVAGILRMPPRQFYAANVLSALVWAPAHVFPGVLLAMAISLAGASAGHLTLLIIAGLVAVSAAVGAIRFYLNRHPLPARLRLPDIAA